MYEAHKTEIETNPQPQRSRKKGYVLLWPESFFLLDLYYHSEEWCVLAFRLYLSTHHAISATVRISFNSNDINIWKALDREDYWALYVGNFK